METKPFMIKQNGGEEIIHCFEYQPQVQGLNLSLEKKGGMLSVRDCQREAQRHFALHQLISPPQEHSRYLKRGAKSYSHQHCEVKETTSQSLAYAPISLVRNKLVLSSVSHRIIKSLVL